MDKEDKILIEIDKHLFNVFWDLYGKKIDLDKDFIKTIFVQVDFLYKKYVSETTIKEIMLKNLSVYDIAFYVCEEHKFNLKFIDKDSIANLQNDSNYQQSLIKMVYDKLVYNDYNNYSGVSIINKYCVELSTLNMFVNRLLNLLMVIQINNARNKLLHDIFYKCFLLIKNNLSSLTNGLETEAMSSWRTLHELECVLAVIFKADEKVAKAYYRHLEYGAFHRGEIKDEKQINRITQSIEDDMEKLEVKKANREKFINYGWLHWYKKVYNDEKVMFNFLGGLQKLADLTAYRKWYEISSDVTHSTPLLVYANKAFLTLSTLKITYESFFRIETMFNQFAKENLTEDDKFFKNYIDFKRIYKGKIETIYANLQ